MLTTAASPTSRPDRDARLRRLSAAIKRGDYRIDPGAVADAALRHERFKQQLLA